MSKTKWGPKLFNSILPVLLAFGIGAVVMLCIGQNPLEAYRIMLGKSLFTEKGFLNTLHYAAPLVLTGLAIAITFKANIFNMMLQFSYCCDYYRERFKIYCGEGILSEDERVVTELLKFFESAFTTESAQITHRN